MNIPNDERYGPFAAWPNFSVTIDKVGLLDTLRLQPAPRRAPGHGEVEIAVKSVALNFKEVLLALGMLPMQEAVGGSSLTFGLECAGIITEVGPDVVGLSPGMDVIALGGPSLASRVTLHASVVAPKPAHLSWEQAAGLGISYMTAYYALHRLGRLQRGESVLIHAAAGGVGLAAVHVAQWLGAEIYASAGSPRRREFLRELGIQHVFDSRTLAFADEIMERTGQQGVSVILNSLAGEFITKSLSTLAPFGRFLEIGRRDVLANMPLPLKLLQNGAGFFVVNLSPGTPGFQQMLNEVLTLVEEGTFRPLPVQFYSLRRLDEAFDRMARAQPIGKVVINIPERGAAISGDNIPVLSLTGLGTGSADLAEGLRRPVLAEGLLNSEGVDVFRRVLTGSLTQVVVSTRGLASYAARSDEEAQPPVEDDPHAAERGAATRPALASAYVPPRNDLEGAICGVWEKFLRIKLIGIHDNFFDLGGDSLLAVQLIAKLRATLGVELSPHSLLDTPTIAGLAESLARAKATAPEVKSKEAARELPRCLVQIKDGDPAQAFYLVHPAGGHVYNYLALAHAMTAEHTIYGVQAEPTDSQGRPMSTIEEMAAHYTRELRRFQPQGPYLIGGASFGGALAYEMACQLVQAKQQVPVVVLIDTADPQDLTTGDLQDAEVLSYLLRLAVNITDSLDDLKQLLPEEQVRYFLERAKKANKMFPAISFADAQQIMQQSRINLRAMAAYRPRPFPGQLLFFQASEQSQTEGSPGTLNTRWPQLALHGSRVERVPGNHITMNFMPHVQALGDKLSQLLAELAPRSAAGSRSR
ncbi:MAG: thioesterase domain-containing protein [Polyangia bacterium]